MLCLLPTVIATMGWILIMAKPILVTAFFVPTKSTLSKNNKVLPNVFSNSLKGCISITTTTTTTNPFSSILVTKSKQRDDLQYQQQQEEEQDYELQRNLRFSGVGRLYTDPKLEVDEESLDPHLEVVNRLSNASVVIVGLGGVGSWAAEAICRSGVGKLILMDLDDICISNTNRQLHATSTTVGKMKIDEMQRRLLDINPQCQIELIHDFVSPSNVDVIFQENNHLSNVTACVDAIDGAKGKTALIAACARYGIPIVTCGGSAGRTDPTSFVCDDLTRAEGDPLLSACRKNLRQQYGFEQGMSFADKQRQKKASSKQQQQQSSKKRPLRKWNIFAVYSKEIQKSLPKTKEKSSSLRKCDGALGTACFVTGTSGFIAASIVVEQIATGRLKTPRRFSGNVESQSQSLPSTATVPQSTTTVSVVASDIN